jgi:hypothetical protein
LIKVRVGEVLRLQRRAVEVDPAAEYWEIGIRSFGKGIFHKEPVSGVSLGSKRLFRIEPGNLVISNVFAWEGAVAVATQAELGRIGSHRFMTFVARDDRINISWAGWFFRSEPGLELIRKASPGSAGRNRTLAIDRFENLEIPLPPIEEQRQIATNLDRIADLSAQAGTGQRCAQAATEATFAALASTDARPIPLADLIEQCKRPVNLEPAKAYRLLGCRWYGDGLFIREERTGAEISASKLYEVAAGDLIYNRLFAWKGSFALAGLGVSGCMVSGEFPVFQVRSERVIPQFLLAAFRSPAFLAEVNLRSSGGTPTSRNRLKEAEFLQIEVPIPAWEVQEQLWSSLQVLTDVTRRRRRLKELADAVMPAAINQAFSRLS